MSSDRSGGREQCSRKESEVECTQDEGTTTPPTYLISFTGQGDAQHIHTVDDRPHGGEEVVVDGALRSEDKDSTE